MRRSPWILAALLAGACQSTDRPGASMRVLGEPLAVPPSGRALVVVHREKLHAGARSTYVDLWDGQAFMGEVGSGQACYHLCDPGRHHIVGIHASGVSVVEAEFFPDQVYDLCIRQDREWSNPLFLVRPVLPGSVESFELRSWLERLQPVSVERESAGSREAEEAGSVRTIIHDFTQGLRQERLLRMAATDFRRPTGP